MGNEAVRFSREEPQSLQKVAAFLQDLAGGEVVLPKGSDEEGSLSLG